MERESLRGRLFLRQGMVNMSSDRSIAWLKLGLSAVLLTCVALFVLRSLHWPLVNDAAVMHYMSFLMDRGLAPYRDFGDMNMPGCYLTDWAAIHTLGGGPLAWRFFDLALMAVGTLAIFAIALPYDWFAGVFGAGLLVLYHGRDGMGQLGQRDLMLAVLLLVAYALLFHGLRSRRTWVFGLFGLVAGCATTIKPLPLLLLPVLMALAAVALHRRGKAFAPALLLTIAGFALPILLVVAWLWHMHALAAFWQSLRTITPYYASLGRRGPGYLLRMAMSPSMLVLALAAAAMGWKRRSWRTFEGAAILAGVVFGAAAYMLQGKGYAYHRYPLAAFLMVWAAIEFSQALKERGRMRAVAVACLLHGALAIAPLYLRAASRSVWSEALIHSLEADLNALGGPELSGHVQCIDSISGCGTALYRMHLMQSTSLLSDFLIFGSPRSEAVRLTRERFDREMKDNPPRVMVVTSWLHLIDAGDYSKLALWPGFASYLDANYRLYDERSFPPAMTGPQGYRVYVRKPEAGAQP